MLQPVVGEEACDFGPNSRLSVAVMNDGVKNLLGDSEEEPPDNGGVDGHPLGIMRHGQGIDYLVDGVMEIINAEEKTEIRLTHVEISLGVGDLHWDAVEDQNAMGVHSQGTDEGVATPV